MIIRAPSTLPICATRPRSARAPASARSSDWARRRCRPAAARWCSIRVSPAALSRTCLGAISGPSIARGTSFLKDRLGDMIFPEAITIIDDPHRPRGLRSKPFDGEGVANRRRAIIDKGVLTTWLLDLRSSRQLALKTTGHAARGTASPPSPAATNVWIEPGALSPQALIADIQNGFYVTEMMGMGVNGVTGRL